MLSAGLLCWESYRSGYLAVGFGGDNFWGGGIRLSFSFTAGVLLFRSNTSFRLKLPFWLLATALGTVFFIPYSETISPIIDPLLVIFYFPFLIALSASQENAGHRIKKTCTWLGDISYPLYVVHYPFIWIFMSYVEQEKPSASDMMLIISAGMIVLVLFAHLVLRWLDEPIRHWLSRRRN